MVSEDKWDKMKRLLREMESMLDTSPDALPRHGLTVIRGFLNYVTQTYHYMIPYLNGMHITIDGWRGNRDPDGWKLPASKLRQRDNARSPEERAREMEVEVEIPLVVKAKPRLYTDIAALLALSEADSPPWRLV